MKRKTESELAKRNFLARMSHEMRTPLNAIIGMATIAKSSNDLENVADCLDKINEASMHLLRMINDVLDLAKIESGTLKLSNKEVNLRQMLKKTAGMVKFLLDAKKQNITLDYDPELPETIMCDEERLCQVLDNFLSNASKFTAPEGNITLSVWKLKEEETACTLKIEVSDTGIGISPENRKKIFSVFEQIDGGMNRKYSGSGMGLAISATIVNLMGGKIKVASEQGKGSVFGFEITVDKGTVKPEEKKAPAESAAEKTRRFAGISILLAEDVEINREIVLSLLEDTGLKIDCAETGLQAVEMFKANPSQYRLILMDIHMPEMDGYEATRQIRAFENEQKASAAGSSVRIPIIAMTANVFKEDVEKCFETGMTGHLAKPIDFEELIKQLDRYLV